MQVDSSLNRQHEGTGLGLALVQKMADVHGGSVEVESEVGKGSRFTINLPWTQEPETLPQTPAIEAQATADSRAGEPGVAAESAGEPRFVLLAEDNNANILTVSEYLESYGFEVAVAHDGWETIAKVEETNPGIILMDIQMPGMDGLKATRRLRADPRFTSTPIIALTALAMPGDRERCLAAGANEYMSKPVSLKRLVNTIREMLEQKNE